MLTKQVSVNLFQWFFPAPSHTIMCAIGPREMYEKGVALGKNGKNPGFHFAGLIDMYQCHLLT